MKEDVNESSLEWKSMTLKEKWVFFVDNITVEPIVAFYIIPLSISYLSMVQINKEKACRVDLGYEKEICDHLTAGNNTNLKLQNDNLTVIINDMESWRTPLSQTVPAILVLFMGAWSDKRACRKPFFLLPLISDFFTSIGLLLCTYFLLEWPMQVAGAIEVVFTSFTGGRKALLMAMYSYIGDVTTKEKRTFRIGVIMIFLSIAFPVGTVISGYLPKWIGYYGVFSVTGLLYLVGFIYGLLRVKEPRTPIPRDPGTSCIRDFFDITLVLETLNVGFKNREGNRRIRVFLLLLLSVIITGPSVSEGSVITFNFANRRFDWNITHYALYGAYGTVAGLIGTLIATIFLSRYLQLHDCLIGLLGCFSKIVASFMYCFSYTPLIFYLGPVADLLGGIWNLSLLSLATKVVGPNEFGKITALLEVFLAIGPIMYGPLFVYLANATLNTMDGAYFLLNAALAIVAAIIFIALFKLEEKDNLASLKTEKAMDTFKYITSNNEGPQVNEGFQGDNYELSMMPASEPKKQE